MTRPRIPIPEPQRGNQPGTWAHTTISTRFSNTVRRTLEENQFSQDIETRIQALMADIPNAPIRPIVDPAASDEAQWNHYIAPYLGQNWFEPPWFFVEHYFYRRILEATGYFQPGEGFGIDPFLHQKESGLQVSRQPIHRAMTRLDSWLQADSGNGDPLRELLSLDLWGNQADLSLWPAEGENKPDHADLKAAQSHILVNDALAVIEHVLRLDPAHARLDILLDNAGFELVCDLILVDYFLTAGWVASARLHVKMHPTYVSDAMEKDVRAAVGFLRASQHPQTRAAGQRLEKHLDNGRLHMRANGFWNSPLDGWAMPAALREELGQSALVISKGDANYRRLLGDRHWPFTAPFDDILSYYPAPLLALRTFKSELAAGLRPGLAETVTARDPDWLIDGRWGLIQFFTPEST